MQFFEPFDHDLLDRLRIIQWCRKGVRKMSNIENPLAQQFLGLHQKTIRSEQGAGMYALAENEFRISSLYQCSRRQYLDKVDPNGGEPMNDTLLGIFSMGRIVHTYLEEMGKEFFDSVEQEVKMSHEQDKETIVLIGHYDGEKGDTIFDFKTVNERAYAMRLREMRAQEHHILQVSCYAIIRNKPKIVVIYINKDNLEMLPLCHDASKELFDLVIQKVHRIYHAIRTKQMPPKDCESWECRYCPRRTFCESDGVASEE